MLRIHKAIVRQFGGFTPIAHIKGGKWVNPKTGEEVEENQLRVEVWVPRCRIPEFKELVRQIGFETKQIEMFVIIPEARVDRISVQDVDGTGLLF